MLETALESTCHEPWISDAEKPRKYKTVLSFQITPFIKATDKWDRITQDTHFDAFLTFHSFPSFISFLFLQGSLKPRPIYYANGLNLKYNFKMTKDIQQPTVKRKMLKKQKKNL